MRSQIRLVLGVLAGALLGAVLGFLIGGGVVFGRSVVADLWRSDGGFSIVLEHGVRIAGIVARLFAVPAAVGGALAGLVAFRPGRADAWGRIPGPLGPALVGLVAGALAAPAGLGLYVQEVLGASNGPAGGVPVAALLRAALLAGVAGLVTGLVLGRVAARPPRRARLR